MYYKEIKAKKGMKEKKFKLIRNNYRIYIKQASFFF